MITTPFERRRICGRQINAILLEFHHEFIRSDERGGAQKSPRYAKSRSA
jgi:hypothetical protein